MEYCFSMEKIKCIYLTKDNYEELLKEDYPDYKSDYMNLEITSEGIIVNACDMVHESKTYSFGWWVEELVDCDCMMGAYPKWRHYSDDEFKIKFQREADGNRQWIVCDERLPDKNSCKCYDVVCHNSYGAFWVTVLREDGSTYLTKLLYCPESKLWYSDVPAFYNVIAWMPITEPEPYIPKR